MSRTQDTFLLFAIVAAVLCLVCAGPAAAGNLSNPAFRAQIAAQFENVSPDEITPSPIDGLWQIVSQDQVGYVTANGRYLIEGEVYDLKRNVNISELTRRQARLKTLTTADPGNMIIYTASGHPDDPAQVLTVFTDVDCLYCRHLHANIKRLQDAGIEVRYMAFPLAGPESKSFHKAEQVWCADNRRRALTRAMQSKPIHSQADCNSPVLAQYRMAGVKMSLSATPAIIAANGQLLPGGLPIDTLIAKVLEAGG